jgi:hypothetical protein
VTPFNESSSLTPAGPDAVLADSSQGDGAHVTFGAQLLESELLSKLIRFSKVSLDDMRDGGVSQSFIEALSQKNTYSIEHSQKEGIAPMGGVGWWSASGGVLSHLYLNPGATNELIRRVWPLVEKSERAERNNDKSFRRKSSSSFDWEMLVAVRLKEGAALFLVKNRPLLLMNFINDITLLQNLSFTGDDQLTERAATEIVETEAAGYKLDIDYLEQQNITSAMLRRAISHEQNGSIQGELARMAEVLDVVKGKTGVEREIALRVNILHTEIGQTFPLLVKATDRAGQKDGYYFLAKPEYLNPLVLWLEEPETKSRGTNGPGQRLLSTSS